MRIALFDICGTLYDSNTTNDFLLYYFQQKRSWKGRLLKFEFSLPGKVVLKVLHMLGMGKHIRKQVLGTMKGESIAAVDAAAKTFVSDFLGKRKLQALHHSLVRHQKEGHRVILVSASIEPVVRAIGEALEVEEFYATILATEAGNYTGSIVNDLKGKKKEHLNALDQAILKPEEVYTNNLDDLDLVLDAQQATVVTTSKDKAYWHSKVPNQQLLTIIELV